MRRTTMGVSVATVMMACSLVACGGDGGDDGKTLTYWASNQGTSIANDREVLRPELDRFERQTGIRVDLEVIGWPDLLNRILAATTSGQGPDVVNIGNTWAASLQATGAFLPLGADELQAIGGRDRFLGPSFDATGAEGETPTSVPLYGLAYGLFYNKQMFADAGLEPPTTWTQFVAAGKRLTGNGRWGLALEGASYTVNAHHAFFLGRQHGAELFDGSGKPQFTSAAEVAAVKQFVDFLATDRIVNPTNAEYSNGTQAIADFAAGRAAMLMWQNNAMSGLSAAGMTPDRYGVVPIPILDPLPAGGDRVNSHVAGINLSVFNNTDNRDGALRLVEFLTGVEQQRTLNKAFGSLPVIDEAYDDAAFKTEHLRVFRQVLAETAAPLPQVPQESQFETTVGTAIRGLFARAASGQPVTEADVRSALQAAQQRMGTGG